MSDQPKPLTDMGDKELLKALRRSLRTRSPRVTIAQLTATIDSLRARSNVLTEALRGIRRACDADGYNGLSSEDAADYAFRTAAAALSTITEDKS